MSDSTVFQGKILSIQVIRALSALCIALFHITYIGSTGLYLEFGVHLFFVMSAFLTMYTTQKPSNKCFLIRRLVPLYWIITLLTFFAALFIPSLSDGGIGYPEFVKSMLFIPYLRDGLKGTDVIRPIVGPAWTLYYEVYFSVAFSLILLLANKGNAIFHKYRGYIISAMCIILVCIGKIVEFNTPFMKIITSDYLLDFVGGIIAFEILKRLYSKPLSKLSNVVLVVTSGICLLSIVCIDFPFAKAIWRMLLAVIAFICFTLGTKKYEFQEKIIRFGDLSYSFYLIHYYLIIIVGKFMDLKQFSVQAILGTIIILGFATVFAFVCWQLIEIDFSNFLKRLLKIGSEK